MPHLPRPLNEWLALPDTAKEISAKEDLHQGERLVYVEFDVPLSLTALASILGEQLRQASVTVVANTSAEKMDFRQGGLSGAIFYHAKSEVETRVIIFLIDAQMREHASTPTRRRFNDRTISLLTAAGGRASVLQAPIVAPLHMFIALLQMTQPEVDLVNYGKLQDDLITLAKRRYSPSSSREIDFDPALLDLLIDLEDYTKSDNVQPSALAATIAKEIAARDNDLQKLLRMHGLDNLEPLLHF